MYAREIRRRNRSFDRGDQVTRLEIPVVSVGNLSVGGTGKTPMVMRLVESLQSAGRRPCVAMRGYKSRGGLSDEAEEYRARLDVPISAQPDRIAGVRAILARDPSVDVVVLDDGFQHRRVARDMDIVLIDATRSPLEDRLLPAGYLRESIDALARADAVVITHAEAAPTETIEERLRELDPTLQVSVARHIWAGVIDENNDAHILSRLAGEKALVVCAIGNPGPFLERAREACDVVETLVLPDHDPYAPSTVAKLNALARDATVILTTQKDWSKLSRCTLARPVLRPALEIGFDRGWETLRARMLEAIR